MGSILRLTLATASGLTIAATHGMGASLAIKLDPLGSYREFVPVGLNPEPNNVCRVGISQIAAYDPSSRRLFVTDSLADLDHNSLDILDIQNPSNPTLFKRVKVSDLTGSPKFEPPGVAARFGLVALAVESTDPVDANGRILLLDHDGNLLRDFDALGSGPERVAFSRDGRFIVAAVQGEKDPVSGSDPRGGFTVIDLAPGIPQAQARFAGFRQFDTKKLSDSGVRIGPDPTHPGELQAAEFDLEPHSITVLPDSRTAVATLQLNNALAVIDLPSARVTHVLPLGLKDHSRTRNKLDATNDGLANPVNWPLWGAYLPDGIAAFAQGFQSFLVTANEGDTRNDAVQVGDPGVVLDPNVFTQGTALTLKAATNLGGLEVFMLPQDARPNASGQFRRLVSLGARSFSVWSTSGRRIYDSGGQLEQITMDPVLTRPAAAKLFNTTDDGNKIDTRSPRRGPQPLGVAVGHVAGRAYAFVGLRKEGGIIVADVTNAAAGVTMDWYSTRDYALQPNKDPNNPTGKLDTHKLVDCELHSEDGMAPADRSDLGPEGILFIPGLLSPDRNHPLLVVNYDQSGSTRIYQIDPMSQRSPAQLR